MIDKPTDRTGAIKALIEKSGGKLIAVFSLGIKSLVPAVPRQSLCPAHAPSTPVAARPVIRHLDLSQDDETVLVLTTLRFITTRHRRVHFRSSSGHSPARFDPNF